MALYRDFAPAPGLLPPGPRNTIADVPGVSVGHVTIRQGAVNTGVTAVVPQPGNLFRSKLTAAVEVINGFGKSAGLMQLAELGTLETPILLTNTFAVAPCVTALIRRAIAEDPAIGRETSTVNAVVGECNDGLLSDIQALAVTEADAHAALAAAAPDFEQGSVGGGTGMTSFGFKGGIGSASRAVPNGHLGVLVQANFGNAGDLVLPDGRRPDPRVPPRPERGSVIVILATDIGLDTHQLGRVCRRAGAGLARLGAFWGNGSGDVVIGFTTRNRIPHERSPNESGAPLRLERLHDDEIDTLFRAACEATEEAVLNALCAATPVCGRAGATVPLLSDWLG